MVYPQTAIRETKEETGMDIEITGLVGIYTSPNHRIEYTSNGEVRQEFSIVYTGKPIGGEPIINEEALEVVWTDPSDLDQLSMHRAMRNRIDQYLAGDTETYLG